MTEIRELAAAEGLPSGDIDRLVGEFRARGRALVQGRLVPVRHVKGPMQSVTDLDVFELRAMVEYGESLEAHVRVYHVEPVRLRQPGGTTIVGLHVHLKNLSDPATVRAHQDSELQIARSRYHSGRTSSWGGASLVNR
ncbi:hypothetical protein CMS2954 [Clavibacter sepedonicus]|uniref:Uncharacterized protein n=1 Tax=Clavibacter sepedonicus TaxID=31964 RepID=B0RCT5_CLASE|nr:hypothetical protein CMS2954 [Clavibacter sepedonicus]